MANCDESGMREECGVFGCVSVDTDPASLDVPAIIATGLTGLQHRGQESSGMVTGVGDGGHFKQHKGMGLVKHVFQDELPHLMGNIGIGHNRYSTAGHSDIVNCQPFVVETIHGKIALAHNGELFNASYMKNYVMNLGTGLTSGSDSELITQILCHPPESEKAKQAPDWLARISNFMERCHLSYSFLLMHMDKIYAVRDPFGNRPLCIGKLTQACNEAAGDAGVAETTGWVVSSETCTFLSIEAQFHSYVRPGEIVEISRSGVQVLHTVSRPCHRGRAAFCIFEYVYFAKPSSHLEGQLVYEVRERCGERLAEEHPVQGADIVSTVPESATPAAIGFAKKSGTTYAEVLCKNSYVGRTFIQPSTKKRRLGVSMKFGVLEHNVRGKRIVLVDDSIVRGNTMAPIIRLLKGRGALEVHIRIASPPIRHPCYMGINIPTKQELIANLYSLEALEQHMGADSIRYISVEGLEASVGEGAKDSDGGYCTACLTGKYPLELQW